MIRVVIVEDDADIRKMTASLLNFCTDIECIGSFDSAESYREALPTLLADIVLMDIGLPRQNGIECIRACRQQYPQLEYLMFTDHCDSKAVFEALSVGASGYVLKGGVPEDLVAAIQDVVAGGSPMSRQISRMVAASFRRTEQLFPELETLTEQERAVMRGLDEGKSYKEIANHKYVSENTIRSQVRSIYQKLEAHSRTEALNKWHGRT